MPSVNESKKIGKMLGVIQERDKILLCDLLDDAGISIRDYYQLKAYMEQKFSYEIKFDKKAKCYINLTYKPKEQLIKESLEKEIESLRK